MSELSPLTVWITQKIPRCCFPSCRTISRQIFWLDVICEKQEHPENLDAENIALEVFGGESAI